MSVPDIDYSDAENARACMRHILDITDFTSAEAMVMVGLIDGTVSVYAVGDHHAVIAALKGALAQIEGAATQIN